MQYFSFLVTGRVVSNFIMQALEGKPLTVSKIDLSFMHSHRISEYEKNYVLKQIDLGPVYTNAVSNLHGYMIS